MTTKYGCLFDFYQRPMLYLRYAAEMLQIQLTKGAVNDREYERSNLCLL